MNIERVRNAFAVIKEELFTSREQAEADLAWDRFRGKTAMEAVKHLPMKEVGILLDTPVEKEIFLAEFNKQNPGKS